MATGESFVGSVGSGSGLTCYGHSSEKLRCYVRAPRDEYQLALTLLFCEYYRLKTRKFCPEMNSKACMQDLRVSKSKKHE